MDPHLSKLVSYMKSVHNIDAKHGQLFLLVSPEGQKAISGLVRNKTLFSAASSYNIIHNPDVDNSKDKVF